MIQCRMNLPTSLFDYVPNDFWKRCNYLFICMSLLLHFMKGLQLCEFANGHSNHGTFHMYWLDNKKHLRGNFHLIWFCVQLPCFRIWRRGRQYTYDNSGEWCFWCVLFAVLDHEVIYVLIFFCHSSLIYFISKKFYRSFGVTWVFFTFRRSVKRYGLFYRIKPKR